MNSEQLFRMALSPCPKIDFNFAGVPLHVRALTPLEFSGVYSLEAMIGASTPANLFPGWTEHLTLPERQELEEIVFKENHFINPIMVSVKQYRQIQKDLEQGAMRRRDLLYMISQATPSEFWGKPLVEIPQISWDAYHICQSLNPKKTL